MQFNYLYKKLTATAIFKIYYFKKRLTQKEIN